MQGREKVVRLVIDMQACQSPGSRIRGIGRYSLALAQAMVRRAGSHECLVAMNSAIPDSVEYLRAAFSDLLPPERLRSWASTTQVAEAFHGGAPRASVANELFHQAMREFQPDYLHVTSLFEGLDSDVATMAGTREEGLPTAVTLYDLIPLAQSDVYLVDPAVRHWYMRKLEQLKRAEHLLAISEFTKTEGEQLLGIDPARITNIRGACDEVFRPVTMGIEQRMALYRRYGIERPFVMYAGGFDSRKNILSLVRAYAALPEPERKAHQLIIVGSPPTGERKQIEETRAKVGLGENDCLMIGYVPDDDLAALYSDCRLYAFPSLQEGFGLPALEAMACGAVVIGSNLSSLPEVIGFDDALFDPRNLNEITSALHRGLTDEGFRAAFLEAARTQVARFTWDESARLAWESLEAAHDRQGMRARSVVPDLRFVGRVEPSARLVEALPAPIQSSAGHLSSLDAPTYMVIGDAVSAIDAWRALSRSTVGIVVSDGVDMRALVEEVHGRPDGKPVLYRILAEQGAYAVALASGDAFIDGACTVVQSWMRRVAAEVVTLDGVDRVQPARLAEFRCGRAQRVAEAIDRILALPEKPALGDVYWEDVSVAMNHNRQVDDDCASRMLLDVSQLAVYDARTGVQRVVRNLLRHFLMTPPVGTQVLPVYFDDFGNCRYARRFSWNFMGLVDVAALADDDVVDWLPNDHFVGLDLSAHILPFHREKFVRLRDLGVRMSFLVHDLLPDQRPDCFDPYVVDVLRRWYKVVAELADAVVCVSRATADDFVNWLDQVKIDRPSLIKVGHFHLGANPENGVDLPLSEADQAALERLHQRPTVLMVSTIEPRKGYQQALEAFELLWRQDVQVNLAIVGKPGWHTDELIARLRSHAEAGERLFWFEGATDAVLHSLYRRSDLLLSASEGEGFGLPVIEAAQYGIPLLLRDLAVFREVAGDHARYFRGYEPSALAGALESWADDRAQGRPITPSSGISWLTWEQSYRQFLKALDGQRWDHVVGKTPRYWFSAVDGRMQTQSGCYERGSLLATPTPGFLIYGPYVDLPSGIYDLRVYGSLEGNATGCWIDMVCDAGQRHLFKSELAPAQASEGILLEGSVSLQKAAKALEIRVWSTGQCRLRLDGIELVRASVRPAA